MNKLPLFIALVFMYACQSDEPVKSSPVISQESPAPVKTEVPEPMFTQEGVLEFRSSADAKKPLFRINIEIAHDQEQRNQGLMWRKKMEEKEGMLFIFDFPEPQSFWMRNTYIPLDIIYIDDKFQVVSIQKNLPTLNDDPRPSGKAAQYVVETNAGLADKYGIVPGVQVAWADFVSGQSSGNFSISAFQ